MATRRELYMMTLDIQEECRRYLKGHECTWGGRPWKPLYVQNLFLCAQEMEYALNILQAPISSTMEQQLATTWAGVCGW